MKRRWMISSVLLTMTACGQSGNEYVGKWERGKTSHENGFSGAQVNVVKDTMTIERNGDGFLLSNVRVLTQGDRKPFVYPNNKQPAIYKDGQLQIAGGLAAYVIDKASGHLVAPDGGGEFTKTK
ncbi:hypothetical protein [Sphingomonas sp. Leaf230]|uniref:hypothetical protein n=1 Tax=Sphingomonas sp. Leaf230 TaxID=1735694 RepID=UPI000B252EA5|nr:hypothetical protein [Sphingomonas sp. Leaf230]